MRIPTFLALTVALGGGLLLQRKFALKEDLEWDDVDKPGEIAEIDGYGVHYVDHGHGPAIVLVHGFGGSTYGFRHLIPAFARDYRVIAVDLKGFGLSERDAEAGLSQTAQVTMLKALLDRCAVDRAVFVGHSMGGGVVMRFAATYPQMAQALVLAASATGEERPGGRIGKGMSPPRWLLRPILPTLGAFASSRLLSMMYHDQSKITPDVKDAYLLPARIKGSMDGLMSIMRDRAEDEAIDDARLTMPVLLLNGAHDAVIPLRVAQQLRERIPHAKLVVIERAAHGLLEEQPAECIRAISDFLRESGVTARDAAATR